MGRLPKKNPQPHGEWDRRWTEELRLELLELMRRNCTGETPEDIFFRQERAVILKSIIEDQVPFLCRHRRTVDILYRRFWHEETLEEIGKAYTYRPSKKEKKRPLSGERVRGLIAQALRKLRNAKGHTRSILRSLYED